jgi:hypothetical protein
MNTSRKPAREKLIPVQERDLALAQGADDTADEATLKQHVDNPSNTPLKDGQP